VATSGAKQKLTTNVDLWENKLCFCDKNFRHKNPLPLWCLDSSLGQLRAISVVVSLDTPLH
jgi:hypothetical protein